MVTTTDVSIPAERSRLTGTLYRPSSPDPPPVVVMAHGFAAQRTWGLPSVARRFAASGIATLAFDYRGFGDSGGGPRRVVSARKQQDDYRAALDFVRDREGLDGDTVALWGMSFSGGHVVELAATEDVEAAVAMVPFTDGVHVTAHAIRRGGFDYLSAVATGVIRDAVTVVANRDPHYVPVVPEDPDDFGILNAPGARNGYESIIPEDERDTWSNRTAARVLIEIPFDRPISSASDVDVPVFVVEATGDRIVPSLAIDRLVNELDDVHRLRVPTDHFGTLVGPLSANVASRQATFLRERLLRGP